MTRFIYLALFLIAAQALSPAFAHENSFRCFHDVCLGQPYNQIKNAACYSLRKQGALTLSRCVRTEESSPAQSSFLFHHLDLIADEERIIFIRHMTSEHGHTPSLSLEKDFSALQNLIAEYAGSPTRLENTLTNQTPPETVLECLYRNSMQSLYRAVDLKESNEKYLPNPAAGCSLRTCKLQATWHHKATQLTLAATALSPHMARIYLFYFDSALLDESNMLAFYTLLHALLAEDFAT